MLRTGAENPLLCISLLKCVIVTLFSAVACWRIANVESRERFVQEPRKAREQQGGQVNTSMQLADTANTRQISSDTSRRSSDLLFLPALLLSRLFALIAMKRGGQGEAFTFHSTESRFSNPRTCSLEYGSRLASPKQASKASSRFYFSRFDVFDTQLQ